jgi:hypothetical protein
MYALPACGFTVIFLTLQKQPTILFIVKIDSSKHAYFYIFVSNKHFFFKKAAYFDKQTILNLLIPSVMQLSLFCSLKMLMPTEIVRTHPYDVKISSFKHAYFYVFVLNRHFFREKPTYFYN